MTKYEELRITNDFIFCKVMSLKKRLCKHLLELILNIKIRDISFVEPQKTIEAAIDMHGVRLDVYVIFRDRFRNSFLSFWDAPKLLEINSKLCYYFLEGFFEQTRSYSDKI